MPKTTFGAPENAVKKIRRLIDDGDEMAALTAVSDYIAQNCGLPHVDPIDLMDDHQVRVFLIWTRLAGRDWFEHHVGEIEDILDCDQTELGRWLDRRHIS